ncbi:Si-specific NAD(P)(+) transhydrogenase [Sulfuriflexus sp.]|uniref:Si-specific NAD(P)(+) transhydrogenase n=1 Tax=Sulfuriflexus sp. TaxID=2015443 RepID=UPI0028CD6A98|nr:Si-specific NAD(P)(+) transhydrogenase [Sulfuriflexus sp.]MDT8403975.1 Si-specific NAD(P)(+) transhydrogenase [Sulfuriflexus sp.]
MQHYDFIVIGSGPAGQRAAIQAAKLGKRVAIIDRSGMLGGGSVHTGTIPSKTLREAALYLSGWDQRGLYGRNYRLKANLGIDDLMQRLHITLQHETDVVHNQLVRNGVQIIDGTACFVDAHTLTVEDEEGGSETYYSDYFLIAVGSRPVRPEGIPFDNKHVVDSDGVLEVTDMPSSLVVVGAGVIGVEYASMFSTLDVKVTLLDGRDSMLGFLDSEIVDELIHSLRERGVSIRLGENVERIEPGRCGVVVQTKSGKRIDAELVLFAAGRIGSTWALKPENAGIETDQRRLIAVNEHFQTSVAHIYAAGDVIGFPSLASTSMEQGRLVAIHAFGKHKLTMPTSFPFGIYAVPEISMVGSTEKELRDKGIGYEIGIARLRETARGQILGIEEGLLKILFSLEDQRVLGVHIIGEGATELIHIGQAAMVLGGTLDYFLNNVFNYPTLAEAYKTAALDAWNKLNC